MSKANPLAGLIGNYGDSDESDDEMVHVSYGVPSKKNNNSASTVGQDSTPNYAGIHPAPIQHCPWSACYDESSGFTYYWNQQTNAVTWEAPPEYLLALKIAQQQLHSAGSAEVSAEEWQLYQQVLAEKQNTQNKMIAKAAITNLNKSSKNDSLPVKDNNKSKTGKKRPTSDDEDEKIELITSYHNSDSESNDEAESPTKMQPIVPNIPKKSAVKVQKNVHKKQKTKLHVEYGPSMPPNMNYTVPIGPELPPNLEITPESKPTESKLEMVTIEKEPEKKSPLSIDNEDSQDEISLLKKLKDKAKLLEKLGGELPSELQQIIKDESNLSATASPSSVDDMNKKNIDIDDMLEEIEKTEFLKTKSKETKSNKSSVNNSPRSDGHRTPPLEELKTLFPSTKNHNNEPIPTLFPSVVNIEGTSKPPSPEQKPVPEKKENMYLMDVNEPIENVSRKKLRISNSVLPERKIEKSEPPAYTTKYSQYIEGFSDQRTGLGFKEDVKCDSPKNTISYGNGLTFTKGETLNEGKQEEDLRDLTDLIGAKLKYLNELQPSVVTPVQEMLIQLQTLVSGWSCGGVSAQYVRRWAGGAGAALAQHEAEAAPPGWTCSFQRYAAITLLHLALHIDAESLAGSKENFVPKTTLVSGWSCGGVTAEYVRRWAGGAGAALAQHEAEAAPPGWTCTFQRYAAITLLHLAPPHRRGITRGLLTPGHPVPFLTV
ncbi:hypothetical protein RR48_05999 [Papilio machaon]|uniref:WW domain-containing protein n=1 Tax=Papilio machaon TaxID=76193 RepID=A0A194RF12_PAPMA|nr:hypothetical protein RR48_05999 [Papilio machaon]